MCHLSMKDRILFLSAIILGLLAGILEAFYLVLLSLLILYITLSTSAKYRHHELSFLFPLSVIICLPVNVILAESAAWIFTAVFYSDLLFFYSLVSLLALISVEELFFGVIGLVIWGKQETIFYIDNTREQPRMHGICLQEIAEDELLNMRINQVQDAKMSNKVK